MSMWHWIVLACVASFVTKWLGYAIPARFLLNQRMTHIASCMTVALLASLTALNTFAVGTALTLDARLAALVVAAVALALRLPFLLVVVAGAVAAALVRVYSL